MTITLHDYWRSSASYRVRIALAMKQVEYQRHDVNLLKREQVSPDNLAVNPQGLVPTLEADGVHMSQSGAILEWLEEAYPQPPLLPQGLRARSVVRTMAAIVGCDIHPLNNLRVLQQLRGPLAATESQVADWIARWIVDGCEALEVLVAEHGDRFAFADAPSFADCYLIPQLYSARRFAVDLSPFPRLWQVEAQAAELAAFQAAHPDRQPDAAPS